MILLPKPIRLEALHKPQYVRDSVEDEAGFDLAYNLVVVGECIVVSNTIETIENADRALQYLERNIANSTLAFQGLDVFPGPVLQRSVFIKRDLLLVEDEATLSSYSRYAAGPVRLRACSRRCRDL